MEVSRFWEIVEKINWGDLVRSCRVIKGIDRKQPYTCGGELCEDIFDGVEEAEEFIVLCKAFEKGIDNEVVRKSVTIEGIGDDAWWDVKAHIVGLGESAYKFAVEHPEIIGPMFIKTDNLSLKYYENFEYCVNNYIHKHKEGEVPPNPKFQIEKVETVIKHAMCPHCGSEMEFDGLVYTTYPEQFPHTCPKCGWKHVFGKQYPAIEYQGIDEKCE